MDDDEDGDDNEDDEGNKLLEDFVDDVETTDRSNNKRISIFGSKTIEHIHVGVYMILGALYY